MKGSIKELQFAQEKGNLQYLWAQKELLHLMEKNRWRRRLTLKSLEWIEILTIYPKGAKWSPLPRHRNKSLWQKWFKRELLQEDLVPVKSE
jgi:hypothetical protein